VEISASTRLIAILGDPVAHSLSPAMHNAACRVLGIDAVYVALRVTPDALDTVLAAIVATGGAGNVTVPHKEAVERCLTRKTDTCARAGACNTFWTEDGGLAGDNTDVAGVRAALGELGVTGTAGAGPWLLVGTGGSARAVAVAAAEERVELLIKSRDEQRARQFARWANDQGARAAIATGKPEVHVAINATPLGLRGDDPMPVDPTALRGVGAALDLVYAPGETRWVRALRAAGVPARDGRDALVHQGAAAFVRFFPGSAAPVEVMRAAVARALRA
jgi:shikimate dehydrogenase